MAEMLRIVSDGTAEGTCVTAPDGTPIPGVARVEVVIEAPGRAAAVLHLSRVAVDVVAEGAVAAPRRFTVGRHLRGVAAETGWSEADLRGPGRDAGLVRARDLVVWRARRDGLSLTQIGRELGGRHHTTIMAAAQRAAAWQEGRA